MTSNLGSEHILDGNTDKVMDEVKKYFRPEFINRVDEIIVFKPLTKEVISKILDKLISDLMMRLREDNIHLVLTDKARNYLVENGYDVTYGARPLKRLVSRTVETVLSRMIVEDQVQYGDTLIIDYSEDKNQIIVRKEESTSQEEGHSEN